MVVFSAESQVGGHEEKFVEVVHVLRTCHIGEVVSSAIGFVCHLDVFGSTLADATVIALASGGLEREVCRKAVLLVWRIIVICETTTLYVVFHLLGDVGLVRRQLEHVAAAAELVDAVILEAQLRVVADAQI